MNFDLSKLTLVGWLVFFTTGAIIMTGIFMMVFSAQAATGTAGAVAETRGGKKIMAYIALGVGVAFFLAGKFGLGNIGFPMFRSENVGGISK